MTKALSPAARKALEWFAKRDSPVAWFGASGPSLMICRKLIACDLLRSHRPEIGMVTYEITDKGRAALAVPLTDHQRRVAKRERQRAQST